MIRLCNNDFVGWWSHRQSIVNTIYVLNLDDYEGDEYSDEHGNNGFGRSIGLNYYHNAELTTEGRLIVHMTPRLIRCGVWIDPEFHRAERLARSTFRTSLRAWFRRPNRVATPGMRP
ncbi:hypothetical protein QX201_007364 [Fusarium graminearum]